jgi:hypothetical protein
MCCLDYLVPLSPSRYHYSKFARFQHHPLTRSLTNSHAHAIAHLCSRSYDLLSIIPYIKRYGTDPATGEKIDTKMLTRLHFHKNSEGK